MHGYVTEIDRKDLKHWNNQRLICHVGGVVLVNLLRAVADLPQLWGLQEALREGAASWGPAGGSRGRR